MGEYSRIKKTGKEVNIGTCSSMYYLTLGDRHKVEYNFNYDEDWFWRLPDLPIMKLDRHSCLGYDFYKQTGQYEEPGDGFYDDWKHASQTLINEARFWELVERDCPETIEKSAGVIQMEKHGLLVNVPCFHGHHLPQLGEAKTFWNGKEKFMRLQNIYTKGATATVSVGCIECEHSWSLDLDELAYVMHYKDDYGNEVWQGGSEEYFNRIKAEIEDYLNEYNNKRV